MSDSGPIVVHAPADWKEVTRGKPYRTLCGQLTRRPKGVRVRKDEQGRYFVCEPNARYYAWCRACRETPIGQVTITCD